MRPPLSLEVRNIHVSVEYYRRVFGVPPQKQTVDYAKFDLTQPNFNLSLVASTGAVSSVNHLGLKSHPLTSLRRGNSVCRNRASSKRLRRISSAASRGRANCGPPTQTATPGKFSLCMST
jgi:hypothetical protein